MNKQEAKKQYSRKFGEIVNNYKIETKILNDIIFPKYKKNGPMEDLVKLLELYVVLEKVEPLILDLKELKDLEDEYLKLIY